MISDLISDRSGCLRPSRVAQVGVPVQNKQATGGRESGESKEEHFITKEKEIIKHAKRTIIIDKLLQTVHSR